ncbi:hypothetical protein ABZX85_47020 [Streptomyces sp. NPDC004539]|uniref:hypothetical protein n=1 Tax=Streptomyces sp. NPDC004539 TaxID=3154280 RepID=UPI00339FBAF1
MSKSVTTADTDPGLAPGGRRGREAAVELAWRPWRLMSEGRVAEGLETFDDAGVYWEAFGRTDHPMLRMKSVLAELNAAVPVKLELLSSVVEGNTVVQTAIGRGQCDAGPYNNVFAFVSELDPDRDVIVSIREYFDTMHAATRMVPTVIRVTEERGDDSAFKQLMADFGGAAGE